ncbi:MAG: cyclopropane-fatty-acyl-phospholipid synthase family protein [Planctomycetota bacterium]
MVTSRFGWADLYRGNRFSFPVSERALLEGATAAGLAPGMTVLDLRAGTGGVAIFLAEEFHVYVRGVERAPNLRALAQERVSHSAAGRRIRLCASRADLAAGPYDLVCALGAEPPQLEGLLGRNGRLLLGRAVRRRTPVPDRVRDVFAPAEPSKGGDVLWRREASPLELERYFGMQERALRQWSGRVRKDDDATCLAARARRAIETFRSHGSYVAWELSVRAPA